MTTPAAQHKANWLRTALHYADAWDKLREKSITPAIVVTHEEMIELKRSNLLKYWTQPPTHAIIIYGIRICEEED